MPVGRWLRRATPRGAVRSVDPAARVSVEEQVGTLARLGLPPVGDLTVEEIAAEDAELMRAHPYAHVLRRLGVAADGSPGLHPRVVLDRVPEGDEQTDPADLPAAAPPEGAEGLAPATLVRGYLRFTAFVPADRVAALQALFDRQTG